ncbi:MAG: S8 family serine peptidase [Sphingomonas phyllosphaerae]|uniref:S8 family serine peptidase n=1 Tax=Sphingomonas phyllosphaerae TaxID=257003 RepID=UPI002FFBF34F
MTISDHRPAQRPRLALRPATTLAAALGLAACGGGAGVAAPGTIAPSSPAPTPAPAPTPTPTTSVSAAQRAEDDASAAAVLAKASAAYERGLTGKSVTIAVLDSGVARASAELTGRLSPDSTGFAQTVARCATCAPETIAPYPIDDRDGHGSGVAAIALAARDGSGMHGVAPEATLLALKIVAPDFAANGTTLPEGHAPNPQLIAPALRYAVDKGAFVSVLALGGGASTTLAADLHAAMDKVRAADRLVVQAVPNHDDGTTNDIAQALVGSERGNAHWFLYAVALDADGRPRDGNGDPGALADRTLAVAGNGVRTIDATGAAVTVSGNSFAAPAVAGAAALLKQYWPQLGGATIARILLDTADDRGATGIDPVYGAGVLDVARALQAQAPASAFATAQAVLGRFSTLTLSGPFGGAPQLAGQIGALTVIDRYGRDFALRGAGRAQHCRRVARRWAGGGLAARSARDRRMGRRAAAAPGGAGLRAGRRAARHDRRAGRARRRRRAARRDVAQHGNHRDHDRMAGRGLVGGAGARAVARRACRTAPPDAGHAVRPRQRGRAARRARAGAGRDARHGGRADDAGDADRGGRGRRDRLARARHREPHRAARRIGAAPPRSPPVGKCLCS